MNESVDGYSSDKNNNIHGHECHFKDKCPQNQFFKERQSSLLARKYCEITAIK